MAVHDMCTDIAALLNPLPAFEDGAPGDEDGDDAAAGQAQQERDEMAEELSNSWLHSDEDPLLSTLASLRRQRIRLESEMRLLIAYGRHFTHPRPYRLSDLADAAGMSISGVRTAYEAEEIEQATEILGRPPVVKRPGTGDG
jgi:hypothetical protein